MNGVRLDVVPAMAGRGRRLLVGALESNLLGLVAGSVLSVDLDAPIVARDP
jgi:hypothetical protein